MPARGTSRGTGAEAPPRAACPRCGYDLSGQVASWADVCPIGGVCSECGASIEWREACSVNWRRLRRMYEFANSPFSLLSVVYTWMVALWPPLIASHRMERQPIRDIRLLFWLPLTFLLVHGVAVSVGSIYYIESVGMPQGVDVERILTIIIAPSDKHSSIRTSCHFAAHRPRDFSVTFPVGVGLLFMAPSLCTAFGVASISHTASFRRRALLRLIVFSFAWIPAFYALHHGVRFGVNMHLFQRYFTSEDAVWLAPVAVGFCMIWWRKAFGMAFGPRTARTLWMLCACFGFACTVLMVRSVYGGSVFSVEFWVPETLRG